MKITIETLANDNNRCGEAPIWDAAQRRLIWADITAGVLFEYQPATNKTKTLASDLAVSGIALNEDGRFAMAGAKGILLWSGAGDAKSILTEHAGESLNFNDVIADAKGRLYAGTYYWGATGMERPGKLYCVDTTGKATVVDEGIEMTNGLGFSPDNRTLYYADTTARKIYAYDVDPASGALKNKRVFVTVPRPEGLPDGLTVDADGFIWNAQWYGSQVVRYDPDGKVERRISVPAQQTSSVMFGGDELNELYITSAGEYWPSEYTPPSFNPTAPMGGALYRVRLDIQGRPEHQTRFK